MVKRKWSKNKITNTILDLHKRYNPLNDKYVWQHHSRLYAATYRYFGSWKNAVKSAGLNYEDIRLCKEWSKKKIIGEILGLYKKEGTLDTILVRKNYNNLYNASRRYFGSWRNAVISAGFNYKKFDILIRESWTKNRVIKEILEMYNNEEKLNQKSTRKKHPNLVAAAYRYFGNWKKAITATGLNYSKIRCRKTWTKKEIIKDIKGLYQKGEILHAKHTQSKYSALHGAANRYFGSWRNAVVSAGLDYSTITKRPSYQGRWTNKKEVIDELHKIQKRLNHSPRKKDAAPAFYRIVKKHFGSWNNGKKKAGLKITEQTKHLPLPKQAKKPSPEMGYVIGAILGDGHVNKNINVVSFAVTDIDFLYMFRKTFKKWSGITLKTGKQKAKESGHKNLYRVRTCSKYVHAFLQQYKNNPLLCLRFPIKVQKYVLKGIFDSEGSAVPSVNSFDLTIPNRNPKILLLCEKILTNIHIKFTRYPHYIGIRNTFEALKFVNEIGITIPRKYKKVKNIIKKVEEKKKNYTIVMTFYKKGFLPKEIWNKMNKKLPLNKIKYWVRRKTTPLWFC